MLLSMVMDAGSGSGLNEELSAPHGRFHAGTWEDGGSALGSRGLRCAAIKLIWMNDTN
jgi:hypothetical protein